MNRPWRRAAGGAMLAAMLLSAAGCTDAKHGTSREGASMSGGEATYVHAVFFTMKPGISDADIDALVKDASELLAKIPTVRRVQSGRRDHQMTRDVNDQQFEVGLVVHFDDRAGHDVYQTHELHLQYVARNKEKWSAVRVYDFVAK